jgi:hypothetical protein
MRDDPSAVVGSLYHVCKFSDWILVFSWLVWYDLSVLLFHKSTGRSTLNAARRKRRLLRRTRRQMP